MQVGSPSRYRPVTAFSPQPYKPQDPKDPQDHLDRRALVGGILGGTVGGLGLGYLGMNIGARIGLESAIGSLGPSPAAQILSVFVPGIQYMVLGAAAGAGLGVAGGVALGGYLGCTLGGKH